MLREDNGVVGVGGVAPLAAECQQGLRRLHHNIGSPVAVTVAAAGVVVAAVVAGAVGAGGRDLGVDAAVGRQ